MPDEKTPRDVWDKGSKVANILAIVAIPVVLGVYGNVVSQSISEQETSLAYVELAVSILVEAPVEGGGSGEDKALRQWASNILQRYSGVPLNEQARQALINRSLPPRLSLTADALGEVAMDRLRTGAMRPFTPSVTPAGDGIVISKEVLRALNDRELSRIGINRQALDR